MDGNKKERRIKTTAWIALTIPFLTIGASLFANDLRFSNFANPEKSGSYSAAVSSAPTPYTGFVAQNVPYYEQPKFVDDYFRNLTENLPTNNAGNCGYTGLAMLLSYYDTYWNSGIIPDQYNNSWDAELDSPYDRDYSSSGVVDIWRPVWTSANPEPVMPKDGIPDEKYLQLERAAYTAYVYEEMLPLADINLISKLYEIALNENPNIPRKYAVWDFSKNPKPMTNLPDLGLTLSFYSSEFGLSGKISLDVTMDQDLSPFYDDEEERYEIIRKEIIEKIVLNGQPVLIEGVLRPEGNDLDPNSNLKTDGHIAIAYGYDSRNDQIIGHMGWKGTGTTFIPMDHFYKHYKGYACLNVDPTLEFSYPNYRFKAPGFGRLSASDLDTHFHAQDDDWAIVSYGDPNYHAFQCVCGYTAYEEHEHNVLIQCDTQNHGLKCKCGDVRYEAHAYSEAIRVDDQTHMSRCACGEIKYDAHSSEKTVYHNPAKHAYICECGEVVGYGWHYYLQRGLNKYVCMQCGDVRYVNPPFVYQP